MLWLRFAGDLGYLDETSASNAAAGFSDVARMLNGLASGCGLKRIERAATEIAFFLTSDIRDLICDPRQLSSDT